MMKTKRIFQIVAFLLILGMAYKSWGMTGYRRTSISNMASINGSSLNDGDICQVILAGGLVVDYYLDAYSSETNDSFFVVPPTTNPGSKKWLFQYPSPGRNRISIGVFNNDPNTAIEVIGSRHMTLEWDANVALTKTLTDPNNIDINMGPDGLIVLGNYDLHIWGNFHCPDRQKAFSFTGTGRVYHHSGSAPYISVCWTGARGDGSTDDLLPYRYAVIALGDEDDGVNKLITPFTGYGYKISDEIEITRGKLHIDFQDNITSTNTDPNCMFYIHGTYDNHISDIKITGNHITLDGNGENVVGFTGGINSVIYTDYVDNIYVSGIHFTYGIVDGLAVYHAHGGIIENCEFSYAQVDNGCTIGYNYITYDPNQPSTCASIIVRDNYAHHNIDQGFTTIEAVHCIFQNNISELNGYGYSSEVIASDHNLYTIFQGCKAFENTNDAFYISSNQVTIDNCTGRGDLSEDPNDTNFEYKNGVYAYSVSGLKIVNSEFSNFGEHGINIVGFTPYYSEAFISNCNIHDNLMAGIKAKGVERLVVCDNDIHDNTVQGVYVSNTPSDFNEGGGNVQIRNNSIWDNGAAGIRCWYTDFLYLFGNVLKDNVATSVDVQEGAGITLYNNDSVIAKENYVSYTDSGSNHLYGIACEGYDGKTFEGSNNHISGKNGSFYRNTDMIITSADIGNSYGVTNNVSYPITLKNDYYGADPNFTVGVRFKMGYRTDDKYVWFGSQSEEADANSIGFSFRTMSNTTLRETFHITGKGGITDLATTNGPVGTFTADNAATTVVSNTSITANSIILIFPTNATAATLQSGASSLYVSAKSAGTSFTVATADSGDAAGTETFNYLILN